MPERRQAGIEKELDPVRGIGCAVKSALNRQVVSRDGDVRKVLQGVGPLICVRMERRLVRDVVVGADAVRPQIDSQAPIVKDLVSQDRVAGIPE